jgi:hypothetical protein
VLEPPQALWHSVTGSQDPAVDVAPALAPFLGPSLDAQATLFTRVVDAAGNSQPWATRQWFADVTPPAVVQVVAHPEPVTLLRSATLRFAVVDQSPGVLRFNFTLDGEGRVVGLEGRPAVSDGAPTPGDPLK